MAYSRKSYVGGAPAAKLSGALNAGVLTMTLTNTTAAWSGLGGTGGTSLPFYLAIDPGLSTEEKIEVTSTDINWASGTVSLTVVRGQDGTTDQYHADQAVVAPVMTATDLDEANYAVTETVGKITASGQVLYSDGVNSLAALAAGTSGYFLKSGGSGAPSWGKTSNVWTTSGASPSVTVSGYTSYIVIADVTCTQPSTSPAGGSFTVSTPAKAASAFLGAVASAPATATLTYFTSTSGTITASAVKGSGLPAGATLSNINLTVIGLN